MYYSSGRLPQTAAAFGLAKSTVSLIFRPVYNAITINLTLRNIKLPSTKKDFDKSVALFPQCLGAVHGTHIQIKKSDGSSTHYLNRKEHFSYAETWTLFKLFGYHIFYENFAKYSSVKRQTEAKVLRLFSATTE